MPKVAVAVPHNSDPGEAMTKVAPVLEKTVADFQGHDLEITQQETSADFKFKSLAFTIGGRTFADAENVTVEIDLPFAAMMYKDTVEKAVRKNLTAALQE